MKKILICIMALLLCLAFNVAFATEEVVSDIHSESVDVIEVTPAPTQKPDWRITISSSLEGLDTVIENTEVTLTANLFNFRDEDSYTIIWQENRGDDWIDVGNGATYKFKINKTNVHYKWRVVAVIKLE